MGNLKLVSSLLVFFSLCYLNSCLRADVVRSQFNSGLLLNPSLVFTEELSQELQNC